MNREAIYTALFNLVSTVPGINTASRRLRLWSEVAQSEQPALFMAQIGEAANTLTNQQTKWSLNVELYLYANTQDSKTSPASVINPLVDAIVNIIQPTTQEKQTLGGLVHYCRINGQIQTDEGVLGDQAVVVIPVEILTT
jgi:hypothetical protein